MKKIEAVIDPAAREAVKLQPASEGKEVLKYLAFEESPHGNDK
jgi:hypothetical protein